MMSDLTKGTGADFACEDLVMARIFTSIKFMKGEGATLGVEIYWSKDNCSHSSCRFRNAAAKLTPGGGEIRKENVMARRLLNHVSMPSK